MRRLGRKREGRGIALQRSLLEPGPDVASAAGMQVLTDDTRGPGTPFPPTLLFLLGLLAAWWLHQAVPFVIGPVPSLATLMAVVGGLILAAGAAMFWWGMSTFARARTGIMLQKPAIRLVTAGPYRWSRNPMYVGFVAMYIGFALIMNSLWPLALLPAVVLALELVVIAREERYLRTVFGSEYEEYCSRVKKWI